jgi:hypothetical protein
MKAGSIILAGKEYPISVNYYAFKEWENATGLQMSDIGQNMSKNGNIDNILSMLQIAYYAVKCECEDSNIEFKFTERQFIKSLSINESGEVIKIVTAALLPDSTEGNKGLPAKKKQLTATE